MRKIGNLFLQGLIAILPIVATLAVLYWLGAFAESLLGALLKLVLPEQWYWPGMGVVFGIVVVCFIGLMVNAYLFQQIGKFTENVMERIPLVKSIYNGVRDIAGFLSVSRGDQDMQNAVVVNLGKNMRVMGFITRKSAPFATAEECVAVYIPLSYQIGGLTIFMPKNQVELLSMPFEEAMRMIITAGMGNDNNGKDKI